LLPSLPNPPRAFHGRDWLLLALVLSFGCRGAPEQGVDLLARLDEATVRTDSLDLEFLVPRWNWHQNGWLEPGQNGRDPAYWIRKHDATVEVPFFSTGAKDLVLKVRCHPKLAPGLRVSVALNDSPLGTFDAGPELSEVRLQLPGRAQRPDVNRLSFSVPRRYEPKPGDDHEFPMAVAVQTLEIHPSGEAPPPVPTVVRGGNIRIPPSASVAFAWRRVNPSSVRLDVAADADQSARLEVELASDERRVSLASLKLPAGGRRQRDLPLPDGIGPFVEIRLANLGPGTIQVGALRVRSPEPAKNPPGASLAGRPNVILYLVDTLRADDLGAYGSGLPTSPEFDRFAAEGLLFEDTMAQSSWTRPNVASLFTGLHAGTHAVETSVATLASDVTTLAEWLRDRGYATAALVANALVSPDRGFAQGFTTWNPGGRVLHGTPSDVLTRKALEWVETVPEPFFLYVHTLDPHDPYEPGDPDWQHFRAEGYRGERDPRRLVKKRKLEDDELGYLRSKYRGEIRQNDRAFGDLLAGLRSRGILDRSIAIFTSDHGEEFLEHDGLLHRTTLYDEIIHVPLAVRLPAGQPSGRVMEAPFRQVDLFPTLASLLGAKAPEAVEGTDHSRAWLMADVASPVPEPMAQILDGDIRKFAIRSGDLKLIVNNDTRGYWRTPREIELYDVRSDPGETRNLVDDRPIAARYLRNLLGRMQAEQGKRRRSGSEQPLSAEEREHLRALGYLQ
jgi:arylsulfatase A-like enzyme